MAAQFQSLLNSYGDDVIDKNTTLLQVKMPTTIHSTDSMLISVLLNQFFTETSLDHADIFPGHMDCSRIFMKLLFSAEQTTCSK